MFGWTLINTTQNIQEEKNNQTLSHENFTEMDVLIFWRGYIYVVEVAEGSVALFSPRSKLNLSKRMERTTERWIRDFVKLSQVGETS